MATIYGVNATKRDVTVPSDKIPPGEDRGRMRVAYDSYVVTAVIGSGDNLRLCKVPAGARVMNVVLAYDDLGTAGTANLGWEASADAVESASASGFIASIDLNAASNVAFMWESTNVAGMHKKFSSEVQVTLAFTAATTATSGNITCAVHYILD